MSKRTVWIGIFGIGFIVGAAVLALAPGAFQSDAALAQQDGGSERVLEIAVEEVIEDGDGNVERYGGLVEVIQEMPEGLTSGSPSVDGIFKSQDGNALTVGTGNISVEVEIEQINDQEPVKAVSAAHSGPEVKVIVGDSTEILFETTSEPKPTREEVEVGQMVQPRSFEAGSLDDLGEDTLIQVWGTLENGTVAATQIIITPIK
ncbi:MAG: hypothetical protein AAF633_10700 [Chloroflexota bacterium]